MNLPERNITAAFFAAICLAAAAVSPQQPVPGSWAYAEVPQQTLPSDDAWWEAFEDPLLDSLISEAEDANYDVLGAMHRMEAASRQIEAARAAYFPTVGIDASYTRRREEGISTNTYALGATLNWEIDLFGKVRANVGRSRAAYRATRAEWVGTMVSMSAAMASAYIGLRTCQAELAVAREHIIRQDTIAGIARYRYECGLAAKGDVDQALTVLYSTRATVPALETSARSYINAIALLLGVYPGDVAARLSAGRNIPHFYGPVVTGVPADLLRRRPDIVQAEAALDEAAAALGIARKDYLPTLSVQASAGVSAPRPGDMFTSRGFYYSVAPTLSWTLFDGLARRAGVEAARETLQAGVEAYNQAVMGAYCEVDNALVSYYNILRQIAEYEAAVASAADFLDQSLELYRQGLTEFVNVANAQVDLLQFTNSLLVARGQASTALVTLYKALGGGYDSLLADD